AGGGRARCEIRGGARSRGQRTMPRLRPWRARAGARFDARGRPAGARPVWEFPSGGAYSAGPRCRGGSAPFPHATMQKAPMASAVEKPVKDLDQVVIRFAGDSGDGMQLTGDQFTRTTALMGNDIATFPDFPAEIRAPAGTLPGVSAFQLRFASFDIHTPGDAPDVLVAMNPAALKAHIKDLKKDGVLILNTASFSALDLKKARYEKDPRTDGSLDGWRVIEVDLETRTREALATSPLDARSKD